MTEGVGSQGRRSKESAEELLARLTLQDEEEDDFIWEEKLPGMIESAKWLVIARVRTAKTFSPNALYNDMRADWNPSKQVVWRRIKKNHFTTQFGCPADSNKAMLEGPWLFREQAMKLKEYDGFKNPNSVKLDRLEIWAQIHGLPDKFLMDTAVKGLASRWGFFGEFVRVRVSININAKSRRFVTGKKGDERVKYQVKYEKLPTFCYNCDEFGHWHEQCGEGEHDKSSFEWEDFIFVDFIWFKPAGRGAPTPSRGTGGARWEAVAEVVNTMIQIKASVSMPSSHNRHILGVKQGQKGSRSRMTR
ncbi:hypothetical protein ZWY2020_032691 [Hordeum vulgare]|nr:hypothetical protein ZWY2020_032691 [Hordeum vulgare]